VLGRDWIEALNPWGRKPKRETPAADAAGTVAPPEGGPKVERTLPLGTPVPSLKRQTTGTWPATDSIQVREPATEGDTGQTQGFYREIADLLIGQLESDPGRLDLHRTLLEVLRAAGEADEYVHHARNYYERTNGGVDDAHWETIALAGRELMPGHALFDQIAGLGPKKFQRFHESVSQPRLQAALRQLSDSYEALRNDPEFPTDVAQAMADGARRPTPLTPLPLADDRSGATIFAKREDARAANDDQVINAVGQVLLAQRRGIRSVVSATRDGIHGLAVATAAARQGFDCTLYMTEPMYRRHYARALQMRRLGAEVRTVAPAASVDAAWQAALQHWLNDVSGTHYVSSLESGPHPFPLIVRDVQALVGQEARIQLEQATNAPPAAVVAGVADGYVGIGLLTAFLTPERIPMYCVEPPEAAAMAADGRYLREHQWLRATRRVQYVSASDEEAMQVIDTLFRANGMAPSLETARTLACARKIAAAQEPSHSVLTVLSRPEEAVLAPQS
jgi:tryptophan synthase beta chain